MRWNTRYTWEKDRFWRKTRSKDANCEGGFSADPMSSPEHSNMGADANRNWGYHWKDTGNRGYEVRVGSVQRCLARAPLLRPHDTRARSAPRARALASPGPSPPPDGLLRLAAGGRS